MRIIVSADGDNLDSNVDPRFGRCRYFIVVDIEDKEIVKTEAVINSGSEQGHGAGIKAGTLVGELKAGTVLTGDLGPNATSVLSSLNIGAYQASGKVREAIKSFLNKSLRPILPVMGSEKPYPAASGGGKTTEEKISEDKTTKKKERIFFPLLENEGEDSKISQHFGHSPFFGLYNVEEKELTIIKNDLHHSDPDKSPIDQIEKAVHPTTIYAKDIGGRAIRIIKEKSMSLKTGDYVTVKEAIQNLDKLKELKEGCEEKQ